MKKYFFILTAILAIACSKNPVAKPDTLLETEEMENILYDISILQASQSYLTTNGASNLNISEYIYKKYKIDSAILSQNQKYYAGDVKKINKIYKNIIERVQNQKNEVDTLLSKEKKPVKLPKAIQ